LELIRLAVAVALADALGFLRQVQGFEQLAGGQDAEGAFGGGIHGRDDAASVDVAAQVVEARPQPRALVEAIDRDAVETEVGEAFAVGLERVVTRSEETDLAGIGPWPVLRGRRQADERRHRRIDRAPQLGEDGADARPAAQRRQRAMVPTGQHLDGLVAVDAAGHRANDDALIHDPRDARKNLGDLDAGNVGLDRVKLAANLAWGFGPDLPHV